MPFCAWLTNQCLETTRQYKIYILTYVRRVGKLTGTVPLFSQAAI